MGEQTRASDSAATGPAPAPARIRYFGDYELLEEIARGGMGVVFKARQLSLNRLVALKMIRSDYLMSPDIVRRFRTEAEAAASLDHPNIVPIFEIGEHEGQYYYSMKLVEGRNLARELRRRHSPLRCDRRRAVGFTARLARAVQYAHQRGVLHRDLKPSNILLDAQDEPQIADFGLAKRLDEAEALTLTGMGLGTPSYMAPEQAGGRTKHFTTAVDVYSLGAILYELLTGQPPFRGETPLETLQQVLANEPRRPSVVAPGLDADLETICLKALSKNPAHRFSSPDALAEDLERWLEGKPVLARPVGLLEQGWRWCKRNPALAGAVLTVTVTLIAASVISLRMAVVADRERDKARTAQALEAEQRQRAETQTAETRDRLARASVANGVRLLNEGDYFSALLWLVDALQLDRNNPSGERDHRVRIASVLRNCPTLLRLWTPGVRGATARFSPDGDWIAVSGEADTARVWDVEKGGPVSPALRHGGSSPIALLVFRPGRPELFTVGLQGAKLWDVSSGRLLHSFVQPRLRAINLSKDGEYFASGSYEGALAVWEVESGSLVFSNAVHRGAINAIGFTPNGRQLVTASRDSTARVWSVNDGRELLFLNHTNPVTFAEFDPTGERVLTGGDDGAARVWDARTGEPLLPPLRHKLWLWTTHYSPSGNHIVTCCGDQTVGIWDAKNGNLVGAPLKHDGHVLYAAFSADGQLMVTGASDGQARVFRMPSGSPATPFIHHGQYVNEAAFHPDGRRLVTAGQDGQVRLWDLRPPQPLCVAGLRLVTASPDGELLLTENRDLRLQIWKVRAWQPVGPGMTGETPVISAQISQDNRRLLVQRRPVHGAASQRLLDTLDIVTGKVLAHSVLSNVPRTSIRLSLDGRRLAWAETNKVFVFDTTLGDPSVRVLVAPQPATPNGRSFSFSPDGRLLAFAASALVRVWDVTTGSEVFPPLKHDDPVYCVRFSADGRWLVTTCFFDTLEEGMQAQVWDTRTGRKAGPPLRHSTSIPVGAFSPDSSLALTGGGDGATRVWNPLTGEPASPRLLLPASVDAVALTPDNRWAAAGCINAPDAVARVWNAKTGEPLTLMLPHPPSNIYGAQFLAGGQYLLTSFTTRPSKRVWDLTPENLPVEDLLALARILANHRIDATGTLEPLDSATLTEDWTRLNRLYPKRFTSPESPSPFWPNPAVTNQTVAP